MIKLYELNDQTRELISGLSQAEVALVLEMATSAMLEIEMRVPRAHLGENGCVELAVKTLLYMEQVNSDENH